MKQKFALASIALALAMSAFLGKPSLFSPEQRINLSQIEPHGLALDGLRVGMTKPDARSLWGEPTKTEDHPLGEEGYVYWRYPDSSWLLFADNSIVRIGERKGPLTWGTVKLPSFGASVESVHQVLGSPVEYDYGPSSTIDYLTGGKELIEYEHENGKIQTVSLGRYR